MKRTLVCAVAALLGAGCATQPPFERPASEAPAAFGARKISAELDAAWPNADWWRVFADPRLDALIQSVLADNRDLKAAASRIAQARASARIAGAAGAPFVTGGVGGDRERSFGSSGRTTREYNATINAGFEPDLWDRYGSLARAANAAVEATREAERVVRLTLTADTAIAYFQRAALTERIAIVERTIATAQRIDGVIAARYDAGAVSGLDRAQSRTNLAAIRAGLAPLVQAREELTHALAVLAGKPATGFSLDARTLMDLPLPARLPAGVPSELLLRRPDIRQAEAVLAAAHADVGVARASLYPSFVLTAETGFTSSQLANLVRASSAGVTLGAALLAPIFQGDRLRAGVDRASERYTELGHLYQQTILGAFRDVENVLTALERLAEQEIDQRAVIEHAERALDLAQTRYTAGHSDLINLLTIQNTLLAAQNSLLQARAARVAAHVNLYRSLGGGL